MTFADAETVDSLAGAAFTTKIAVVLVVIDEVLTTSAAAVNISPPLSVEKGDCENVLIANIILGVHYQITMQK